MSELIRQEENPFNGLSLKEKTFIEAYTSPKINTLENEVLNKHIINISNQMFATSGQRINDDELKAFCIMLKNELKTYFANVSIKDVETAINKGVRREFGEYYGLNMVSVNFWLKKYLDSEDRRNALKKLTASKPLIENKPTPQQINETMQNALKRAKELIKTNEFNIEGLDFGNCLYDYLTGINEINFSNEQKNEFMNVAKQHLTQNALNQKFKFEITQKNFNKIIEGIEAQKSTTVVILAKKYALKNYLESLIKNEKPKNDDHTNENYFYR